MTLASRLPAILQAVMKGQPKALQDTHYPQWHHAPVTGLMNDPNGFTWFAGRWHLFYQWNPLAADHKYKCWGHWSSADLVQWRHEPLALMPDEDYDRNGCYSGSAVDNAGRLTLCYTGNVKFDDGSRTAWQCLAVENSDGGFDKVGPVLPLPAGYSGHVRDPKVWQHEGVWYMVLGAQDLHKQGKVLLFSSANLHDWESRGEIAGHGVNGLTDAGYMWECPDLFPLDGKHLLLFSPAAYLVGDFDYASAKFNHGELNELDAGFEFYAPQTALAPDGRRLLVGWMGVPDGEEMLQPTREHGWIHQMTCLRELTLKNGKLYQQPIAELAQLREAEQRWQGEASLAPGLEAKRLELQIELSGELGIHFGGGLTLEVTGQGITLQRPGLATGEPLYRYWHGKVSSLQILCDSSSVEIFINHGEGVMSSRYFPQSSERLSFNGESEVTLRYWSLRSCMIE